MEACRHGGLTELGDAEVTEQEGMASSGHATPDSLRLYVKRTARQRASPARKRRILLALEKEQEGDKTQNEPLRRDSE